MLPNGQMYNVASNGRIIRRCQQTDMEQTMEPYNNQREDVYSRTYYSNPQTRGQRRSPSNRYANYEHNNVKYKKRPEQYQRRFADSNNEIFFFFFFFFFSPYAYFPSAVDLTLMSLSTLGRISTGKTGHGPFSGRTGGAVY